MATLSAVLGIDAAWTARNPSGVALAVSEKGAWRCVTAAASYGAFLDGPTAEVTRSHGWPGADLLLAAARRRLPRGARIEVVAIDMPLALHRITKRREADQAVSRAFGARHCSTHSPTPLRPGKLATDIRRDFERAGFPLATKGSATRGPRLIEVYPHPALLLLCSAKERLRYKASRMRAYWPDDVPDRRVELLRTEWRTILTCLGRQLGGVELAVPPARSRTGLKAFEDTLDALVCAWVGAEHLAGRTQAYGDDRAAIWIPRATSD